MMSPLHSSLIPVIMTYNSTTWRLVTWAWPRLGLGCNSRRLLMSLTPSGQTFLVISGGWVHFNRPTPSYYWNGSALTFSWDLDCFTVQIKDSWSMVEQSSAQTPYFPRNTAYCSNERFFNYDSLQKYGVHGTSYFCTLLIKVQGGYTEWGRPSVCPCTIPLRLLCGQVFLDHGQTCHLQPIFWHQRPLLLTWMNFNPSLDI